MCIFHTGEKQTMCLVNLWIDSPPIFLASRYCPDWKIFVRRFGFNRGHTFLVDHWLSLSGGRSPCYVSFNALQRRCHFAKPWCSLRSVVGSISRETRWQASNLCQPSISMKVDILQIFTLFHPACESCPDGVCYIICLFRVHIWDGSKSHLVQLKRKATQTGEMQEGGCYIIRQTSCIARQRCTNRVMHHQKYRFMQTINTQVARKWILHTTKCTKLHQMEFFLGSRATLLDCRCYFVHIPWWPPCPSAL